MRSGNADWNRRVLLVDLRYLLRVMSHPDQVVDRIEVAV
jgi:hypothetical protein